jgi:hypothetical protein
MGQRQPADWAVREIRGDYVLPFGTSKMTQKVIHNMEKGGVLLDYKNLEDP